MKWYIYIVRCIDNSLYIGITNNLERRLGQHNKGKGARYTRGRRPVVLLKHFTRTTKGEALKLEYKLKQLSVKKKIEYKE